MEVWKASAETWCIAEERRTWVVTVERVAPCPMGSVSYLGHLGAFGKFSEPPVARRAGRLKGVNTHGVEPRGCRDHTGGSSKAVANSWPPPQPTRRYPPRSNHPARIVEPHFVRSGRPASEVSYAPARF